MGIAGGLVAWMFVVPAGLVGSQRNSESLTQWWQLVATKACGSGYDLFAGDSYSLQNQSLLNAGRHLGNWTAHVFAGGSDDRRRVAEGEPLHVMDAPSAERGWRRCATLALLAAGLVWQCGKTRDRLTLAAVFGLCTAATLVVAPIARAHYFLLLIPALPLVPLWFVRAGHERLARWAAWLPAGLVVSHYLASPLVGRVGLLGIGTAVWFAGCAGAMIVVARRASRTAQPAEVYSFRVRAGAAIAPPDQAVAAGRLKVDDRTVARRGLGSLPADLFHHERDG